jgi:hypothetical protein
MQGRQEKYEVLHRPLAKPRTYCNVIGQLLFEHLSLETFMVYLKAELGLPRFGPHEAQ